MTPKKPQSMGQYLKGMTQVFQDDPLTRIEEGKDGEEMWWCDNCNYVLVGEFEGAKADEDFRASGLPSSRNTFADFQPRPGTEEAYATARQYASEKLSPVLVLLGGVGAGKTHLAEAVGNQMMGQGSVVRYVQGSGLLREMYSRMNSNTDNLSDYIRDLMVARLLIIDDLGTGAPTEWAQGQIGDLMDDRIQQGRRLLVTSNLTTYEATEAKLGTRIADRLFDITSGTVGQVILNCESYRHWQEAIR
jgi:DNA replication protein DnaC